MPNWVMRPVIARISTTIRCSGRHAVLDRSGESVSKMGKISGMGFRFSKVVWVVPTTSSRKPYSHSSTAKIFGEGIDVGYGSGALGIIDVGSGLKSGSIPLAGHPESFQLEQDGPRIFVNVPAANQIAIVDRIKKQVVSTWLLDGAHANFPMALDEANHRLFVGCRN